MTCMPKRIDPELRARAVRLVAEHRGQYPTETAAVVAVAKQLGVSQESVRRWLTQARVDGGERPGVTTPEHAEIRRLHAENRMLQEKVEILRAATVFFAGELDPRNR
ncbi:transposase [Nakamurella sp. YIM 132087]|uniref:Transposase n=1 Tax=Nakamurella alba TaxID=2665158 RepID=A0A7K1FTS5_9ACTN|nr:transposase [Nakamurella alba]